MKRFAIALAASLAVVIACGGSDTAAIGDQPTAGSVRGACFPNGTCNAGLQCLSNVCVEASTTNDGGGGGGTSSSSGSGGTSSSSSGGQPIEDAGRDADAAPPKVNDAGDPCPGAVILHPGTEKRDVDTSVPFSGRARDADCAPITGDKLVWTDSVGGGTIGTGEIFNHTFTVKGSHTITLTATLPAAGTTTASVTFPIQ